MSETETERERDQTQPQQKRPSLIYTAWQAPMPGHDNTSAIADIAAQCCISRTVAFSWGGGLSLTHSFSVLSENIIKSHTLPKRTLYSWSYLFVADDVGITSNQIKSLIVKTIKLTPRQRMALNGTTLQRQLTVHNTGAEPKMSKCQTTRVVTKMKKFTKIRLTLTQLAPKYRVP